MLPALQCLILSKCPFWLRRWGCGPGLCISVIPGDDQWSGDCGENSKASHSVLLSNVVGTGCIQLFSCTLIKIKPQFCCSVILFQEMRAPRGSRLCCWTAQSVSRGHGAPGHEPVIEHTTVFQFVLPEPSSNTSSWTKVHGSDFYWKDQCQMFMSKRNKYLSWGDID